LRRARNGPFWAATSATAGLYDAIDQWAFCASITAPAPAPSTTNTAPTATLTTNPYAVLPPQPLTVGGFVVVAIVGVDDAIPAPGQFL
jgi:hypothetical protein